MHHTADRIRVAEKRGLDAVRIVSDHHLCRVESVGITAEADFKPSFLVHIKVVHRVHAGIEPEFRNGQAERLPFHPRRQPNRFEPALYIDIPAVDPGFDRQPAEVPEEVDISLLETEVIAGDEVIPVAVKFSPS